MTEIDAKQRARNNLRTGLVLAGLAASFFVAMMIKYFVLNH